MNEQTTSVPIEIKAADLADLEKWAHNSEQSVHDLLQEALRHYLEYTRADLEDLRRRVAGPEYEHEEAMRILAEHRQKRAKAA